jgi:hypothetical protein
MLIVESLAGFVKMYRVGIETSKELDRFITVAEHSTSGTLALRRRKKKQFFFILCLCI